MKQSESFAQTLQREMIAVIFQIPERDKYHNQKNMDGSWWKKRKTNQRRSRRGSTWSSPYDSTQHHRTKSL